MTRAYVVLNPAANRGAGRRAARPITEAFRAQGWEVEVRATGTAGEEAMLAREAARGGWPLVIAAGGDGTVHGVVNGLLDPTAPDACLAVIPVGSGNDYARLLKQPRAIGDAVGRIVHGTERHHDVGRACDEYFANGLGVGIDTEVIRAMQRFPRLRGFPLYLAATVRSFLRYRAEPIRVDTDADAWDAPLMLGEVAIGTSAGGGFRLTPDADPTDGLFDVCLIREVGLLTFLRYLPRVIAGTHQGLPPVTLRRAKRVRLATPGRSLVVHLDGELRMPAADHVEATVHPRRLRVRCAS